MSRINFKTIAWVVAVIGPLVSCAQANRTAEATPATALTGPDAYTIAVPQDQPGPSGKVVHVKTNNCYVHDIVPEDDSSMISVCSATPIPTESVAP